VRLISLLTGDLSAMTYIPDCNFPHDGSPPPGFEPGTFGCHEALYLASTFRAIFEEHLAEHPAIRANPEWDALATTAAKAMSDLCHSVRDAHRAARELSPTGKDQLLG